MWDGMYSKELAARAGSFAKSSQSDTSHIRLKLEAGLIKPGKIIPGDFEVDISTNGSRSHLRLSASIFDCNDC
jgi:hypothetical protein